MEAEGDCRLCPVKPREILSPGQGGGYWAGKKDMLTRSERASSGPVVCRRYGLVSRPQGLSGGLFKSSQKQCHFLRER